MEFICKRCGYNTNVKCNLITHFERKKPCKPILENIEIETLLFNLNAENAEKSLNMLWDDAMRNYSVNFVKKI